MRAIDEIAEEICTLSGHINAANHRWLVLIVEFDRPGMVGQPHAVLR